MPQANVAGEQTPIDWGSDVAIRNFQIMSALAKIAGATIVQVMGVNTGGMGTVDVQPLVQQSSQNVDGAGNITIVGTPHGVLYGLPYLQPQSGLSAVELVPTINDIGLAIFADRDISGVISVNSASPGLTGLAAQALPGSRRLMDMADGMYLGAFPGLNPVPTQFIKFDPASGITVTSPTAVTVNAPAVTVNATTSISLGKTSLKKLVNDAWFSFFDTHVHVCAAPGSPSAPPTVLSTPTKAGMETAVTQAA